MNLKQLPHWLKDHYLAVGLLMLSGLSQSLFAATLIVNSLEDTTLADGQCTLREALENANQDTAGVGDCLAGNGDDVIDLTGLNGTITLSAQLEITSNLILEGPGAEKLTLSGNNQTYVFYIYFAATVEINGIKISEGYGQSKIRDLQCEEDQKVGGIVSWNSTLTINNSVISENLGGICGGDSSLTLVNSTVSRNYYYGVNNSDYRSVGSNLIIINSMISENDNVGIFSNSTLSIIDSTVSENTGGGIFINSWKRITNTNITDSTVSGNAFNGGISQWGGGTLTVTNSTISGNSAEYGGGISNESGTLTITNSTISGNSANYGGGIYGDLLTIINSTVSGNSAHEGGGIEGWGLTIINSTVSGNSAHEGGGIKGGDLTITNSTISENNVAIDDPDDSRDVGGGIYNDGTLNLQNTLIANNTNGDCYSEWDTIGTNLNNFIGDGSCDPTFSGDPKLGPLANNGGPTFTHALRRGSPAIDVGDDTICAAEPVNGLDQRGVARFGSLAGNHCDIGAYEYQKPALAILKSFTIDANAIKWETLAELGTQGFYLWQAEPVVAGTCEAFTNPQLVISKPISAKGSEVQGEAYQAAVAVNLNGCYGIQEIPSGQIYVTPRPGRNEWTGEQWLTR